MVRSLNIICKIDHPSSSQTHTPKTVPPFHAFPFSVFSQALKDPRNLAVSASENRNGVHPIFGSGGSEKRHGVHPTFGLDLGALRRDMGSTTLLDLGALKLESGSTSLLDLGVLKLELGSTALLDLGALALRPETVFVNI